MNNQNIGVYVHIPFCMSKCSYCSFVSRCAEQKEIDEYFDYLCKQIKNDSINFKHKTVTSIYFGGGTPSFVDSKHIVSVVDLIKNNFVVNNDCEITIECNPCSTTEQKLKAYKHAGINRISFGVQSLNDDCLQIIGRKHTAKQAIDAIKSAQYCGFVNISTDLLIGIPNQTIKMLEQDINCLVEAGVKHISAYMLMLEEGTKLYESVCIKHTLNVANDDDCVNMYDCAYILLDRLGVKRYEISNFATSGYECKHNINYWNCGEYVGFGLSAYGYFDGKRIDGLQSFDDYYNFVKTGTPKPKSEVLTKQQKIEECIMLGFRLSTGISVTKLKELGFDVLKSKKDIIELYKKNNIICVEGDNIVISKDSFGACNQIILDFLP